ncbi:MAG TPA: DoxX family protein [Urbifossiella sp.]|nr:DoxX family protein [Urbifossiella sp.]
MPTQYLPALMYAGLAGTVLALIVATGQNRWSPRVFFLLALRLSIGWHFLFEGLHKVHSVYHGPSETVRVFSSEPYFKVAPGPLGEQMRKQFTDPGVVFADRVRPTKEISPTAFDALSIEQQAEACPASVATKLGDVPIEKVVAAIKAEAAADKKAVDAAEKKGEADARAEIKQFGLQGKQADDELAAVKKKAAKAREAADTLAANAGAEAPKRVLGAKAAYAAWVHGAERRDVTVKFITGAAPQSAPERLAHIDRLRGMLRDEESKLTADLGQGNGIESKRIAEIRTEIIAAETSLAKDADDYVADLRKALGDESKDEQPAKSLGKKMDVVTMWFLVGVGACLMGGLLTRLACVLAAGFLVMTYLAHPPFPWYPLPPNTEGNPVFINKNVIEAVALLTIATFPTGRWLGLDALPSRVCCRTQRDDSATA